MKTIFWTLVLAGALALIYAVMVARQDDWDRMQALKAAARQANDRYKLDRAAGVYSDYPLKENK